MNKRLERKYDEIAEKIKQQAETMPYVRVEMVGCVALAAVDGGKDVRIRVIGEEKMADYMTQIFERALPAAGKRANHEGKLWEGVSAIMFFFHPTGLGMYGDVEEPDEPNVRRLSRMLAHTVQDMMKEEHLADIERQMREMLSDPEDN